jgi:hypothetical protein
MQTFSNGTQALKFATYLLNRGFKVTGTGDGQTFTIRTNAPASERESALFVAFVR